MDAAPDELQQFELCAGNGQAALDAQTGVTMYRVVVLTTLVILLSVIVGVSVAQESRTFAGGPNGEDPPGSTMLEQTSIGTTGPEVREDTSKRTIVAGPTVGEPEKPAAASPGEETPGSNDSGKPGNSGRKIGKPEHAGKAPSAGKPRAEVGHHGNGEPEEPGNEVGHGRGAGQRKVTLCHKGRKTLTVGSPALAAHLRHDDTQGGCRGEVPGAKPSGVTKGPEAAKNDGGGSGGPDKVILCHKNKNTLAVGAGAQAAHLRHGDSPGACP
jgi:hypothetical protein